MEKDAEKRWKAGFLPRKTIMRAYGDDYEQRECLGPDDKS